MVVVVISSMPSWPCTTSARSSAELAQRLGDGRQPAAVEHADELALTSAGFDIGPSRLKMVRLGASSTRGPADVAHGAVMARRHQEADAGFDQRLLERLDRQFEADAERRQHVGRA